MHLIQTLSVAATAALGLAGVYAAPSGTIKPVNGDSFVLSGAVPTSAIGDLQAFVTYAGAAYSTPEIIKANSGLQNIQYFVDESENLEAAFVGLDQGRRTIVVSWRGTVQTLVDWLADFDVVFDQPSFLSGDAKVSSGFIKCYNAIQSNVTSAVQELASQNPGFTVTYTGHSLGGATATIAAAHALTYLNGQVDPSQIFLVNFGSPRVGNSDFAEFFNSAGFGDIWRSANFDDIVPQLPPRGIGYVHVGPSSIGLDESANPPNPTYCGTDGSSECEFGITFNIRTQHGNYYDLKI
ncbi:Alpha/Beta hydrolase protein [Blyttiomyces helicus]|uniref:Alpha/Beta hydrolase protein n=1 Tax=Blyttiomyces helicus TaxID=388810 RepID=A0A4P9W5Y6_9FUNG|nr:Alpha/Beta hydrolase protein [Blyttiomyces helicus]|eukprot:RKO87851.1 Alpha/Beta hydrolase protein [Blyttiomyces helicus]